MARRGKNRAGYPFGTMLLGLFGLTLFARNWTGSAWIGLALLIHLCGVRRTLCRVETTRHQPCRWRVRGYLRSCDFHKGLKMSLPVLWRGRRSLPTFMWARHDLASARYEPQPSRSARGQDTVAPGNRNWSAQEKATTTLAVASLVVALMSFVRDLVAG